jgi:integrase
MSLARAHEKAEEWRDLIERGIDPAIEEKRRQEAAIEAERAKQAAPTVSAAFEVYCKRKLAKLRTGRTIEKEMRRELGLGIEQAAKRRKADLPVWADQPLADITAKDVKAIIGAIIDRGHEAQAHQIFSYIRAFFSWICDDPDEYGIEDSPCLKLKPIRLIGKRVKGEHALKDHEIAAYWRAADAMGFPDGSFLKLSLLSGIRRNEAARLQWQEVYLKDGVIVIEGKRMKNGDPHLVTLVPEIRALLESCPPRGRGGDFVFSNTAGHLPVCGFSRIKYRLDEIMRADLQAQGLEFKEFDLSRDVRRTVRTQLSKLRISGEVCEAVIAHAKPGLHKVYNLHEFQDEKAEALQLWHAKLRDIVTHKPDNVITLRAAG